MKKNNIIKVGGAMAVISFIAFLSFSGAMALVKVPNDGPGWETEDWSEDNLGADNWPWKFVELPLAWGITTGSADVKIGVIDTGFDVFHEDLKDNINLSLPAQLIDGHGTHVAGIIGAKGDNDIGISGTMWDVTLLPYGDIKIPLLKSLSSFKAMLRMTEAIESGAKVINYSVGRTFCLLDVCSESLTEKENEFWEYILLDSFKDNNVVFVFAAGNDNVDDKYSSPSSIASKIGYDYVISVANMSMTFSLDADSNYGNISVAAPGDRIYSTLPNNSYDFDSGTSMSAPFVSGLAGLIYSVDPLEYKGEYEGKILTAKDVKDLIVQGAINGSKFVSGPDEHPIPIINAYESLKLLVSPPTPTVSPWSMYQHDPQHTGRSEYIGPQTDATKWILDLVGVGLPISPPVIGKDGAMYVVFREGSTHEGSLYAISSEGSFKWKSPTFSISGFCCWSGMLSVAIDSDDTVYVGGSSKIFAFNADGSVKWTFTPDSFGFSVGPQITIDNEGTIYVTAGVIGWGFDRGYIFALNSDGTLKWLYENVNGSHGWYSPALSQGGNIYATSRFGYVDIGLLEAIDSLGILKWLKYFGTGSSISSPSIGPIDFASIGDDGTVYVASDGLVRAFDPYTGDVLYVEPSGVSPQAPVIAPDDSVIISSSAFYQTNSSLKAINADGGVKWIFPFSIDDKPEQPIVDADGTVYVGVNKYVDSFVSATLYVINQDGTLKWSHAFSQVPEEQSSIQSHMAMSFDGTLYLVVYDAGSGFSRFYAIGE